MPEKLNWFLMATQLRGSVLPIVLPRVLFFGGLGVLVSVIHHFGWAIELKNLGELTNNVACNLVLGLLLVFHTNTAYDRYWEGRKAWGTLVTSIRNLSREIQVSVVASSSDDLEAKNTVLRLLAAFAIATKTRLRREPLSQELAALVNQQDLDKLKQVNSPPLELTLWLGNYIEQRYRQQQLDSTHRLIAGNLLSDLAEGLTSCERILNTPIPIAYNVYLKRLILVYCSLLPFGLVDKLTWWTGIAVALISFVLLGVDAIGSEIEDPFGYDPNDLPLDELCQTLIANVESTMTFVSDDCSHGETVLSNLT